ncbi:MAG: hypothetical protein CSA32_02525 [Desulfobulbus propionicus]|nr:MAG: hypothetical protein CSA32_02525 [Desulfobulbus propionicus]
MEYPLKVTTDTLFDGKLVCRQHEKGYRFSVDALLLAGSYEPKSGERQVLDLCCGCGVVGLILAYRYHALSVSGFEMQAQLAALAADNIQNNTLASRMQVIQGNVLDISTHFKPESFDVVVCNPPYRKGESGRLNDAEEAALARHESEARQEDFVSAAAFCVKNRGRVLFVYPAVRLAGLTACFQEKQLQIKKMQLIYSYPGEQDASLVILEAMKNGGEQCRVLAPFYIYSQKNGTYTAAMQTLYT